MIERGRMTLLLLAWCCAATAMAAPAGEGRPGLDLGALLAGPAADSEGFAVVAGPRPFDFPADHGSHPDYRSEWWYLVSHLEDPDGRPFGLQFTLFRQALAPPAPAAADASPWRTRQVWMAHVALTTPAGGHLAAERFARAELGLAGVEAEPFAAWLEDWRLAAADPPGMFPLRLELNVPGGDSPWRVVATFSAPRGPILQGDAGYSRKSERAGNASHYYSFTRMQATAAIEVSGRRTVATGLGWMDREWSTSALDPGQVGWDWFALHLDDGRDLMVYRIRRDDGSIDAASGGVLVTEDGRVTRLGRDDFELAPERHWQDETGARWPIRWRLRVPSAGIDGAVTARHADQLNRLSLRYWEGQVCLDGPVTACGYLEMTGYAAPPDIGEQAAEM